MGGVNSKRIIKKMKREGQEFQEVVTACSTILAHHGFEVNFPWEIPTIVEKLLMERTANNRGDPAEAQQQVSNAYNRLADLAGQGAPHRPTAPPALQGPTTQRQPPPRQAQPPARPTGNWEWADDEEEAPARDPWEAAAQGALGALDEIEDEGSYDEDDEGSPMSLDEQEMMRRYQAGQAKLVNRVETQGVQYKNGASGPAAGQRIAAHPKISAELPPAPSGAPPQRPQGDGSPRIKGANMSREEAAALIERTTGRRPGAPGVNPNAKPPGF